MFSILMIMR